MHTDSIIIWMSGLHSEITTSVIGILIYSAIDEYILLYTII